LSPFFPLPQAAVDRVVLGFRFALGGFAIGPHSVIYDLLSPTHGRVRSRKKLMIQLKTFELAPPHKVRPL